MKRAPAITRKDFELLKKQIRFVIQRNKIKTLQEIEDKLDFHRSIHVHHVRKALEEINAYKEGHYMISQEAPAGTKNGLYKTCWRCNKDTKITNFKIRREFFNYNHRLNICMDCLKEERSITGTSINDLLSIYEFMEYRYNGELKPEYYKRFWETVTQKLA
jgi:predicted nuclease with TOPRIM domain